MHNPRYQLLKKKKKQKRKASSMWDQNRIRLFASKEAQEHEIIGQKCKLAFSAIVFCLTWRQIQSSS